MTVKEFNTDHEKIIKSVKEQIKLIKASIDEYDNKIHITSNQKGQNSKKNVKI